MVDYDGTAIPVSSIDTATFTLRDKKSGDVINSQLNVNVASLFDGQGWLTMTLSATDNAIQSIKDTKVEEIHSAIFVVNATVNSIAVSLTEEIQVRVVNLKRVT